MTSFFSRPQTAPPKRRLWRLAVEVRHADDPAAPLRTGRALVIGDHDGQLWRMLDQDLAQVGWDLVRVTDYTRLDDPVDGRPQGLIDLDLDDGPGA